MQMVVDIVNKHGRKRENLLPILQDVAKERRYLTEDLMIAVAKELELSSAEVYGVASFYSFLDVQPRGEHVIRVCKTITCDMAGKDNIILALKDKLKIDIGETTPDHKFTLLTANCMGWCHKGPAMLIDDDVYTEVTPEKAVEVIDKYLNE
jgi:NADH-quinone oxidoreductase subunit E